MSSIGAVTLHQYFWKKIQEQEMEWDDLVESGPSGPDEEQYSLPLEAQTFIRPKIICLKYAQRQSLDLFWAMKKKPSKFYLDSFVFFVLKKIVMMKMEKKGGSEENERHVVRR